MKKIIVIFTIFALSLSLSVSAKQEGIHEAGAGLENPEIKEASQGTGQALINEGEKTQTENSTQIQESNQAGQENGQAIQTQNQESNQIQTQNQGEESQLQVKAEIKAKNSQELKEMIQNIKNELKKEVDLKKERIKSVYENQNQVREAVHAMLAMEDIIGGVGQQVSEIARNFNNSVEKTIQAEEKIQTKNRVYKFFFGGDQKSADTLDLEINQNQKRLKELKRLQEQCDCNSETKEILDEQVKNLETEQERLQKVVMEEKENKGLIGAIISWFKK